MLMHQASAYLSLKRNEEARAVYAKVTEYYPQYVPALNNLAWLTQDKDLNQAIKIARQAESIAPDAPFVKDTLGMLLMRQGDNSNALRLIQEAAKVATGDPQIQLHYALMLAKHQRNSDAQKILQALVKKFPGTSEAKEAQSLLATLGR